MKIVYLSTARLPDTWAHGLQVMHMCEALAAEGHNITLLVPRRAATIATDPFVYYGIKRTFAIRKVPCIDLFPGSTSSALFILRNFSFLFFAKLYLWFTRYDVLYTRETLFIPYFSSAKTVLELHTVPNHPRALHNVARVHKLVVITHGIQEDLAKKGAAPPKVLVAPDAVDLAQFEHVESKAEARARLGLSVDVKVAMYIGRFDTWKGVGVLFDAAQYMEGVHVVAIGGEADEVAELKQKYPKVAFLGSRPFTELPNNQAAADVLVLPNTAKNALAERYTSPMKLFTYMASLRPIVASDLPSIREIVDEQSAMLVIPDDPRALARGITTVLTNSDLAQRLATAAREKATQYTWHNRAKKVVDFIRT